MLALNLRQKCLRNGVSFNQAIKPRLYYIAALNTLLCGSNALAQESAPELDEVVVTGSRVIKNGDDSPSPTTIISTQEALNIQPGQLNDALQILPVFAGSRGSSSNPSATGAVAAGNGAANQMNLRNLGIRRTLPLLDGLRIPPSLFNGSVDVDIIPQMLVERVDVVTGGVSAVYGSDAVSGVVNYVLDKDYTGVKFHINEGISDRSDAEKTNIGIAFGTDLAGGRGHFTGSYEYRNEEGVLRRSDREWIRQAGFAGAGTAGSPYVLIQDTRQADFAFGGVISTGVLAGMTFKSNGIASPFVHGQRTSAAALEVGGDGAYYDSSLLTPMKANQFFGRFDFDFTDSFKFHVQTAGNIKTNHNYADYVRLNNVTLRSTNAFLAPQYQQQLATAGQTTFRLRSYLNNAPRLDAISESDQWISNAGLAGKLGDYDWGMDLIFGKTKLHTTLAHNINYEKLAAALDAVIVNNTVVCASANIRPDCIPLNPFGPTAGTDAAYNYFQRPTDWNGETEMQAFSGFFSGAPFEVPAGPVNMALSGEWRKTTFSAVTTSDPDAQYSCTGIQFNCTNAPRLYEQTLAAFPKASDTVWEVAYEFDAPVFGNPGDKGLNVNGAARYTSYEQAGDYVTWKLGLDWRLLSTLKFRGTTSRDIRAPNLYDLYAPPNGVLVQNTDLLTGLSPSVLTSGGGNANLTAEKGETITAGIVWQPVSNLSVALDYFHITITDALSNISGRDPNIQNECYASGGASLYCSLHQRANGSVAAAIAAYNTNPASVIGNPAYAVTRWGGYDLNVAEQETSGFDLELNYGTQLFDRGLNLRLLAAYQPHVYTRQPGFETTDYGGVGWGPDGAAAGPKSSVTGLARYQLTDKLSIDLMQRWRDRLKFSGVASEVFANGKDSVASYATTNLNLTYQTQTALGETSIFLNVQNVFDRDPPIGAYTANGTRAGLRDGFAVGDNPMGRYYTLGLRVSM